MDAAGTGAAPTDPTLTGSEVGSSGSNNPDGQAPPRSLARSLSPAYGAPRGWVPSDPLLSVCVLVLRSGLSAATPRAPTAAVALAVAALACLVGRAAALVL